MKKLSKCILSCVLVTLSTSNIFANNIKNTNIKESIVLKSMFSSRISKTGSFNRVDPPKSKSFVPISTEEIELGDDVLQEETPFRRIKVMTHRNSNLIAISSRQSELLDIAKEYLGTRYLWGSTNPRYGLDCSAFVQLVYRKMGIDLPRVSRDQSKVGKTVSINHMKPGDLIFFKTTNKNVISHVGIYIGNGKMIHASSYSKKVVIVSLDAYNRYFYRKYSHVKRVF